MGVRHCAKFRTYWACLLGALPESARHRAVGSGRSWILEGIPMKKVLLAVAAAAIFAAATLTTPTPADARCYGCAVGAGVGGGPVSGAIIGGAIANSQPRYYAPAPGYVAYQGYGAAYPAECPGG